MKAKFFVLLIIVSNNFKAQDLPINPESGLVSLIDSIDLKIYSRNQFNDMFGSWNTFLQQQQTTEKIFKLDHKTETVLARFKFDYPSEIGRNKYISRGTISYKKQTTTPVFGGSNPPYRDQIEFDILFSIENNWLKYEVTNFVYTGSGVQGRFEDNSVTKNKTSFSVLGAINSKKAWNEKKVTYFERVKQLNLNCKEFIAEYTSETPKSESISIPPNKSQIDYESYQSIETGMSYTQVKMLLKTDGKEVSSSSSSAGGKTVTQRIVKWYSENEKSKHITIIFVNDKVKSKSQANL